MSGHSKFNNIKHKKEKADAAKGKIFTVIGHELALAVKQGGADPASNSKLRDVIAKAKAANMPNDTIDRGIKKAAGDLNAVNYEELTYEGFGPGGVGIIVKTLTDNKNRTGGNVRSAFTKGHGNLGAVGSVSYLFKECGRIYVDKEECDMSSDDLMMLALDSGAEDFNEEDEDYEIITSTDKFTEVREALEKKNVPMIEAEITMIPDNYISVKDEEGVFGLRKTLELLDEDDDVKAYYTNWEEEDEY